MKLSSSAEAHLSQVICPAAVADKLRQRLLEPRSQP
jgi:hypothetical protein